MGAEVKPGDVREEVIVDNLLRTQLVMYSGASGDYNPLHSDEPFARHAGYPGVFGHGMLTMGMTGRVVTDWFGPDKLKRYGGRFRAQVWPGDTLTTKATVDSVEGDTVELTVVTTNQNGEEVFAGYATATLA
jgi:acyl dehydratase